MKMKQSIIFGLSAGLLSLGLAIGGYFTGARVAERENAPIKSNFPIPVFASASSESDGVVIATGTFGSNIEAMYYLDSQSARLSAAVISRSAPLFQKAFTRNIKADLAEAAKQFNISVPTSPKFLMVTGEGDVRNVGSTSNLSKSFVYVAEINTGVVLVYALPGANERDLLVKDGEIVFWTCARLNDGLQGAALVAPHPTGDAVGEKPADPQLIDSSFFRNR